MTIEDRFDECCEHCKDILPDVVMMNIYERSGNEDANTMAVSCKLAEACPTIRDEGYKKLKELRRKAVPWKDDPSIEDELRREAWTGEDS